MSTRSVVAALSALAIAGSIGGATLVASSGSAASASSGCTHSALSPYVQSVRESSASFIADLAKYGATRDAISTIAITLKNGQRVSFTFSSTHFTLRGSAMPASCKSVTATDDWLL